jgi:hypothetical protein
MVFYHFSIFCSTVNHVLLDCFEANACSYVPLNLSGVSAFTRGLVLRRGPGVCTLHIKVLHLLEVRKGNLHCQPQFQDP